MNNQVRRPSVPVLRFLGATGTVTGSRFLIDTPQARLLVDCGMFQGLKPLRLRNWDQFPVPPQTIDAVVLTHAHLDHSGYIPALVRNGFRGPVFCTPNTLALSRIVLPDSGHLQEEDAAYANRKGFSKHAPALPLYTEADATAALGRFQTIEFEALREVAPGIGALLHPAGHILGSSIVELRIAGQKPRTVVFSGDLGRPHHPILRPPSRLPTADVALIESTYGDRQHEDIVSAERFRAAIVRTVERGGMVVIPSFAVDRTEVVLFHLRQLMRDGTLPMLPVYVDSPMALATLRAYRAALSEANRELHPDLLASGDPFDPGQLVEVHSVEESMDLNTQPGPGIIISASGMATGGRVLHHLLHRLPDERNTIVLVGFQAEGTRGRALVNGARSLKLLGRYIAVRAEVVDVPAFSVHADQSELLDWLRSGSHAPDVTFVVHGEPAAAQALHDAIEQQLGWTAAVPKYLEQVRVD